MTQVIYSEESRWNRKEMERRTFLGTVAATCATAFGSGRIAAQVGEEDASGQGWGLLPYDEKRRRANPDGAGLPQGLAGVEEVWEFNADTASTPVTSGGTVYTGTEEGVVAIDALTGEETWRYETTGEIVGTPAVHNGAVYAGTDKGRFVSLDARTGDERWSNGFEGAVTTSPNVSGVDVYFGTENYVCSLDTADGSENWKFETRVPIQTSPALTEELIVYADGGLIFALNRFTGEQEWRSNYSAGSATEAVVGETRIYTAGKGTVYAQRIRNGVRRWSKSLKGDIVGGPVLQGSALYVATDLGFLYSLDLNSDGWKNWEKEFPGSFVGSPVLVDGVLYGVTLEGKKGRLYAVDPSNGDRLGEYVVGSEQVEQDGDDETEGISVDLTGGPTVAGAKAYVVGEDGVRAFGDEEKVPPTASFDFSPRVPSVDDTVSFDASSSSSGSAPIEGYTWRFSSDAEEFSAGGETYEEVFESRRDWTVSLTVTDEDGLSDTATKEMKIGGAGSGGSSDSNRSVVESSNETAVADTENTGVLDRVGDGVLLALGAIGAVVSALGFSAYWRMEPERKKLHRRKKKGGLCPDCGASVKVGDADCRVCGTELPTNGDEE